VLVILMLIKVTCIYDS